LRHAENKVVDENYFSRSLFCPTLSNERLFRRRTPKMLKEQH
jgi:hypothetical protein